MGGKPSVTIVGAGLGGLCVGVHLKRAGLADFEILEQGDRVGGTWRDNSYPGCACDTPVALYQFSFAPSLKWSHLFPRAAEVQTYAEDVADQFGLRPHLHLNEGGRSAEWDDARMVWRIRTGTGRIRESNALVVALGQLNRPMLPQIEGRDSFGGKSFHSARWDHGVKLKGKRVAVIGSAASAVQLIPEVARQAGHLTVFQRTPNWVCPRNDRPITREEVALMLTEPPMALKVASRNRELIYDSADHFFWQAFAWTPEGRAAYTRLALNHLEAQVPDKALRKKLTPDYPIGCKRILFADDYYPALMRDNVTLVTDPIARISRKGVVTRDGALHGVDVLIFATGFETTGWHWSMDVKGRGGVSLADAWAEAPQAYLGITTSGFPNMFMTYGPNTNLGHNTITFMIERQAEYIAQCVAAMEARDIGAMDVTAAAQARFNRGLQDRLAHTTWADPKCASWYKTADGRITQNWGSHTRDYAKATKKVAWRDYAVTARRKGRARLAAE